MVPYADGKKLLGVRWSSNTLARRGFYLGSVIKQAEKEVSREVKNDGQLQTGFAKKGAEQESSNVIYDS